MPSRSPLVGFLIVWAVLSALPVAAKTTANLVKNGGFETGSMAPWKGPNVIDGQYKHSGKFGAWMYSGGEIAQVIDLSPYAAAIDRGNAVIGGGAWIGGFNKGCFTRTFYNSQGRVLRKTGGCFHPDELGSMWVQAAVAEQIPPSSRRMTVSFKVRVGNWTDTGIDDVSLRVTYNFAPPTIAQGPMKGPAGTTFTQWGTGFTPNGKATLHFRKPDGTEYPTLTQKLDGIGHFDIKYTAPAEKPEGNYTWWAVDKTSGLASNRVTYTITRGNYGSPCNGGISGRVVDGTLAQTPLTGVTVTLRESGGSQGVVSSTTTNATGAYGFTGLACDTYFVTALSAAGSDSTEVAVGGRLANVADVLTIKGAGTPVIVLPGIMGSSIGSLKDGAYPELPPRSVQASDRLHIHAPKTTGFTSLEEELEARGFVVYPCPWDWRLKAEDAAVQFLLPKIKEALDNPGNVNKKVSIVAHSAGGLVARALIQGSNLRFKDGKKFDYRVIDKLAMVGTPNLGAAAPYYIWEGGDPKLLDDIIDTTPYPWFLDNFYERTVEELWEAYDHGRWDSSKVSVIRRFVRDDTKTELLRDLMSTEAILVGEDGKSRAVGTSGNVNTLLSRLNDKNNSTLKRMSPGGASGTIRTALFIGKAKPTLGMLKVGAADTRYEDGRPRKEDETDVSFVLGDGTVPFRSAVWPSLSSAGKWADLLMDDADEVHSKLVKAYAVYIAYFLSGLLEKATDKVAVSAPAEPPPYNLVIRATGAVRFLVTTPLGERQGIDAVLNAPVAEVTGATMIFSDELGEVTVPEPVDGEYQVTVFGEADTDFRFGADLVDGGISASNKGAGYVRSGTPFNIALTVDRAGVAKLTAEPTPLSPSELRADPYGGGGVELTAIRCTADALAPGFEYVLYSRTAGTPHFLPVGPIQCDGIPLETTVPWAGGAAMPATTFAVSERSAAEESFFSLLVANDDRDHDGLSDLTESEFGSDATLPDSDHDGLGDADEYRWGAVPWEGDGDGDGFGDLEEATNHWGPSDPRSPVRFWDDFSDARSNGDRHWRVVAGSWAGVRPAGESRCFRSKTLSPATALVRGLYATGGRIETQFKFAKLGKTPSVSVIFDRKSARRYRSVKVFRQPDRSWAVALLQAGRMDGMASGLVATVPLPGFVPREWHTLSVDVYADGAVKVSLDGSETVSNAFPANSGGPVGLSSTGAIGLFDDFKVWIEGVLPTP